MKTGVFTKEHYVSMWATVLESYQWWGHDLTSLLDNIKKTNPVTFRVFNMLHNRREGTYEPKTFDRATYFYQKLSKLIPNAKQLYTKLEVKSLNKKNKNIAIKEKCRINREDYVLAILCFLEEVANLPLSNSKVSSMENTLTAHSDNIVFEIEKNKHTNIISVKIIIPGEISIEYCSSEIPIK